MVFITRLILQEPAFGTIKEKTTEDLQSLYLTVENLNAENFEIIVISPRK